MSLTIIQATDTFNTWLDQTNNLISLATNTSAIVLVNNTSTGNVSVNGTISTVSLVANANVVLGGTSLTDTTPVFKLTTNSSNSNTVSLFGTNLSIVMTNTVMSGIDLSIIMSNTVINGGITTTGVTNVSANATITNSLLAITSNSSVNTLMFGTNVISVTHNTSGVHYSTNSTIHTTQAVNTFIVGTNLTVSPNTSFTATANFASGLVLGGPIERNSTFVTTPINVLSGGGEEPPLAVHANTIIYRVSSEVANKVIAGVQQANTSQYRELVIFNTGTYDVVFQHANTAAGVNAIYCPANTDFMVPRQGTALLYYDANASVQRWRVISAPTAIIANTTANGYVSTTTQSFAGDKTFVSNVSVSNTTSATIAASVSNATANVVVIPGKITFNNGTTINSTSYTGTANNSTYAFGKSEGALNVNSATTATTANNSTYAFGKAEANLNVNSATTATTANNSTYAFGKSEANLNVNSATTATTANNSTYAFGKTEGNLNVNSATTATTANNSTYAFGKTEANLNVNSFANRITTIGLGAATSTETVAFEMGTGRTSNGYCYIDMVGDTTYSDFGTRWIRGNGGPNAETSLVHRGTGPLVLVAQDAGYILLKANNTDRMIIDSRGVQTQSTLSVGGATPASTGAGITFPAAKWASSDANTLDDYEEGTWTPSDASGASLSFSGAEGTYVKIGKQVTAWAYFQYPSTSNGNDTLVSVLPYTTANYASVRGGAILGYTNNTSGIQRVELLPNDWRFRFIYEDGTVAPNSAASGSVFAVCLVYYV